MLKKAAFACAAVAMSAFGVSDASAATYFGQDVAGVDPNNSATWVNSNAARTNFLNQLIDVASEDFESFSNGDTPPIALQFPGLTDPITATLVDSGVVQNFPDRGRFATSPTNYYQVITGNDFRIEFDKDVAAFGFFGTDIGDFAGQLVLSFFDENDDLLFSENVGASNAPNQNILFWGVITENDALRDPFRTVRFDAIGGNDGFGFDDLIVGEAEQVADVPLPAAGWLLISGVAGLAGFRRLSKKS